MSAPTAAAHQKLGSWAVRPIAGGVWQISWRSPSPLPMTGDRPQITQGTRSLGPTTVSRDRRVVRVEVAASAAPDLVGLHVMLSGDRLDRSGNDVARAMRSGPAGLGGLAPSPAAVTLPDDPATPGPYAVVSSDYQLDPVKMPQMKEPIEMVGHVVEPAPTAATGPRPLVLFLHGRHNYCYDPNSNDGSYRWPCRGRFREIPSHLGYDYIQQVLASQGFATVSIRVNGINAQDFYVRDGGADARAKLVQAHLDHWVGLAADHQLDLSRVVLVGHSRGGEGVNRASVQIPLSAPYRIVGQVLLAPTDFGTQTVGYVPTVTLLPYCDGDVFDLQGQRFTDTARDLAPDDTSLKSSVLVLGANHNFFNTEWTPGLAVAPSFDDWGYGGTKLCSKVDPGRLRAGQQRAVGVAYVVGAARLFARNEQQFLPLFDGTSARVASTGAAVAFSHAIGGGRELRRPGIDAGRSLPAGATSRICVGALSFEGRQAYCARDRHWFSSTPHWPEATEFTPKRSELELSWTAAGQSAGLVFDQPLDLSGGRRLELRSIVDPLLGDVDLHLRLHDAHGASADLTPIGGSTVAALPRERFVTKRWAQAVLADPATATGVDLTAITGVDVVGESPDGRLWVLDVASAPAALPAVPEQRLAVVSLGQGSTPEGDALAGVGEVPFTIRGELTRRAWFVVGQVNYFYGMKGTSTVDLAPGQTSGSLAVDFPGNWWDDVKSYSIGLSAYAKSGVIIDNYLGRLVVYDDDPAPKVSFSAPPKVGEGAAAVVQVRLSQVTGYGVTVRARVVSGPGRQLTVADVPRVWLNRMGVAPGIAPTTPLSKARLVLYRNLPARHRDIELKLPTLQDTVSERAETVTFRVTVSLPGQSVRATRTVVVTG